MEQLSPEKQLQSFAETSNSNIIVAKFQNPAFNHTDSFLKIIICGRQNILFN